MPATFSTAAGTMHMTMDGGQQQQSYTNCMHGSTAQPGLLCGCSFKDIFYWLEFKEYYSPTGLSIWYTKSNIIGLSGASRTTAITSVSRALSGR